MKVILADGKGKLNIGRQTDNERTTVVFPLADLLEEFPGGAASLKIRRPHENEFYVSETTSMDGTNLLWLVQDYDVAIEGDGEVQLYYTVDDVAAPGRIFKTHSDRSLTDQAAALPGWSSWKDELIAAGNDVLEAIYGYDSPLTKKTEITLPEETSVAIMRPVGGIPLAENELVMEVFIPSGNLEAGIVEVFHIDENANSTKIGQGYHAAASNVSNKYWYARWVKQGGIWVSECSPTIAGNFFQTVVRYWPSESQAWTLRSCIEYPTIMKMVFPVLPAGTVIKLYAR